MKLLKSLLRETAEAGAIAASSIANVPSPLMQDSKRGKKQLKPKKTSMIKRLLFAENDDSTFNVRDVISKIKGASDQSDLNQKAVMFGMEDEDGNLIKLYVDKKQAVEFEKALQTVLGDSSSNPVKDVAEVIFDLRNKFNIIDIKWPKIEEEEEEFDLPPDDTEDQTGTEDIIDGEDPSAEDMPDDSSDSTDSEDKLTNTLNQIIDMMRADAEARKQEAEAKQSEYASKIADTKLKAEEETLDMEEFFKKKSDEKKEARKIANLAKYRHELSQPSDDLEI